MPTPAFEESYLPLGKQLAANGTFLCFVLYSQ